MNKQGIDKYTKLPPPPAPRIHADPIMYRVLIISIIVAFLLFTYLIGKLLVSEFL